MADKKNTPKVRYQNRTYEITGISVDTIRICDGFAEFCVLANLTSPANKEARDLFKEMKYK